MSKKIKDENGNVYVQKSRFTKRFGSGCWWLLLSSVLVVL